MTNQHNLDGVPETIIELPKTRKLAMQVHSTKYYTGAPCHKGHTTYRYTASGMCAQCSSDKATTLWKLGIRPKKEVRSTANKNWNASKKAAEAKQKWKDKNPKRAWAVYATGAAKFRALQKGLPFDLDKDYILSICSDECPIFGTQFVFTGNKRTTPESASLDRLDPAKGYVKGNVVVMSLKANTIKNAFSSEDVAAVAAWMRQKGL
jgi:hypothetical protein